jgi:MFS family permease
VELRQRFIAAIRVQFGRPTGFWGRLAGLLMAHRTSNRRRNAWAVSLLDVQPEDRVLEIGFGPGIAIRELGRLAWKGYVCGIDHSELMVRRAKRLNAELLRRGVVDLRLGSVPEDLPAFDEPFDKIQGAGAALLSPAALAAITGIFHGVERKKALSVWASLGVVGFTAGVLIGGLLTTGPGWRWVFFINVPVGIVLLAAIRALVPLRRHADRAARVDVLGAVTVTAATGSFIYGMINAGDEGWADLGTLLPIVAAIVLYGVFVVVERTVQNPLMQLNLMWRRPIAAGAFLMLIAAGVLIADLFLGSQYLQHFRGLSALETGLFFLPPALALMIGAITAGRLVGTRPVAVVTLALVAMGNGLLIGVSADGNVYVEALPGVVVFALGGGPLFVCATTTALGRASLHEAGLVSGVVQTFNQLGAAIFVAVASTVAAAGLTRTPSINGFTDAFTVFTIAAAVAAVLSLRLVPPGK